ncbi:MAG: CBS domain-containing protein [Anaerolineae bacterium]|nr:CBS domain-containing protein [Anaerolineae bacterium]
MIHLLIVILDDLGRLAALLQAWRAIGLPGATILESAGAYRTATWLSRVGLGALNRLFEAEEVRRRTLLVAVEDDALLEQAIAEAERVVGGFDRPDSGLLLVLPVAQVRGLHKVQPKPRQERLPPALRPDWMIHRDTLVGEVARLLELQPALVKPETPLDEAARAMLAHPRVHVVCVVNDDDRLIGILDVRALADDLFFHIMPEEFLSEVTDLDHLLDFADKSRMRSVADAMKEPVWVKRGETVKEAFKRMHDHGLPGLPVVDDRYQVVGYINLLELMAVCLHSEDCIDRTQEGT